MTWTKLGSEFFDDCANHGLSDAAVRTHAEAISWVYGVEQLDLTIRKSLVRRFAGSPDYEQAVLDLLAIEWWESHKDSYVLLHHADVIRSSIVAQHKQRVRNKQAQATHRRKKGEADVSAHVSDDVSADADRQTDKHASRGNDQNSNAGDDPTYWKTPAEMAAEVKPVVCWVCTHPLNPGLAAAGETTHPSCDAL